MVNEFETIGSIQDNDVELIEEIMDFKPSLTLEPIKETTPEFLKPKTPDLEPIKVISSVPPEPERTLTPETM